MYEQMYSFEEIPVLMTVPEVAQILGVGLCTAYDLVRSGQLEVLHVGRQFRVARHALLRFINALED